MYWSCGNTKRISTGDMFFLMKLGVEPKGIIGCGYISSEPYDLPHWDEVKAAEGKTTLRTDLLFKSLSEEPLLTLEYLEDKFPDYEWTPRFGGLSVPEDVVGEIFTHIQGNNSSKFTTSSKRRLSSIPKASLRLSHIRLMTGSQQLGKHA